MRVGKTLRGLSAIGALMLTLTAGCTISIQPWTKPIVTAPNGPVDLQPPLPNRPLPMPQPGGALPSGFYGGNDAIIQLSNKLNNAESNMNSMQAMMNGMKRDKTEQDELLARSATEIDRTLTQIGKLRQDLKNWRTDVDEMRQRLQTLESNRDATKQLLDYMGAYLERENKGPKLR